MPRIPEQAQPSLEDTTSHREYGEQEFTRLNRHLNYDIESARLRKQSLPKPDKLMPSQRRQIPTKARNFTKHEVRDLHRFDLDEWMLTCTGPFVCCSGIVCIAIILFLHWLT